jgi:hypothetical protein
LRNQQWILKTIQALLSLIDLTKANGQIDIFYGGTLTAAPETIK